MPDVREYQVAVEEAERAARDGDVARADRHLREALRIQETALGPTHVDLASTLNNLAVVSEALGNMRDAEQFFRRAYAIASTSRPATDPLVVTSLQNLNDFCDARGLPLEDWPGVPDDLPPARPATPAPAPPVTTPAAAIAAARPAAAVASAPRPVAVHDQPAFGWPRAVLAAAALMAAVVIGRAWLWPPTSEADVAAPAVAVEAPAAQVPTAAPPPVPPARPLPTPSEPATAAAPQATAPTATAAPQTTAPEATPRAAAPTAGVRVVVADVCASLTTSGVWRCTPLGTPARPVRAAFYTRVAAPSALRLEHRWYKGEALRQRVTLSIAANPSDGYRTYSRQTVTPGPWRVELRAADGALLHEVSFEVQ